VALPLARAQCAINTPAAARDHYELALHGICQAGQTLYLSECLLDYADFLLAQGDSAAATPLLDEAWSVIERSGMKLDEADWYLVKGRTDPKYRKPGEDLADKLGYASRYRMRK